MGKPEDLKAALDSLEPGKQKAVHTWMNSQMFIARELGFEPEQWFEYVEWAFNNPFDFEFAAERGIAMMGGADGVVDSDTINKAAQAVGGNVKTKLPGSGGMGNLLNMIVDGKKDREA